MTDHDLWAKIEAVQRHFAVSVAELERRAGVPRDTIRRIKRGETVRPSADLIDGLATAAGVRPGLFIDPAATAEDIAAALRERHRTEISLRDAFAVRVARIRAARGLTLPAFARACRLPDDACLEIESALRDPTLAEINAIMLALGDQAPDLLPIDTMGAADDVGTA